MELLDLLETIRTDEANVKRIFQADDGTGVHALREARGQTPAYMKKLAEAMQLVVDINKGRKPIYLLREAMSTSDFPLLFGDIIDRQLLAAYREYPAIWQAYCLRRIVKDFRSAKSYYVNGGDSVLPGVSQGGEYEAGSLDEGVYTLTVKKYGRRLPFFWETLINDDLGAFEDVPVRLGRAARRTEDKLATQLHVDASGPHASIYTSGNGNIVTGNPALSIQALQTGYGILASMTDGKNEPIMMDAVTLEVPPALEITANNIINAIQVWINQNAAAGTPEQQIVTANWLARRTKVVVNPYIPIVASTANGNTSWFLHADPNSERPAFQMGLLRGHEDPEIFMKEPNARRVGGGVNPMDGDFDTDTVEYKVRHVVGGSAMEPKSTVASNGSGS